MKMAGFPVILKVSPATGTDTRKAEPVPVWQSVQWQIVVFSGSASPSIAIWPQAQAPWNFIFRPQFAGA
jgi:hypothetical protein